MKKISGATFYFKVLFPTIWVGGLLVIFGMILFGPKPEDAGPLDTIVPLMMMGFMMVVGLVSFKKLLWSCVDQVHDAGDSFVFRKGGIEQRVALIDVVNISYSVGSPSRATIRIRHAGSLGKDLSFFLPARMNPMAKAPLLDDLIDRVDAAKLRHRS